jgi:murein DD-endopeptidase MepM/ murein hydrolase activator NlpD
LATPHHEHDRTTRARSPLRSRLTAPRRALLVAGLLTASLFGTQAAIAAPGTATDARAEHDAAAAEVERIAAELAAAEETLQRMTVEAEAAGEAARAAQVALDEARAAAAATARELAAARAAVAQSEEDVAELGREAYMGNDETFGDVALLLDAESPTELLQQATTLELLGRQRTQQLQELEAAEIREAEVDRAAREAVAEQDRAARAAREAEVAAAQKLADAQGTYDAATAEKARLDEELRAAQVRLLARQGVQEPEAAYAETQAARAASSTVRASVGGAVVPTQGRVTSCYGQRWGTMHSGVDIAAPIGTPIHAPEGGVVLHAGTASGFGYAVAVQHGDGTITLYGHVNEYFVSAGQVVSAGQHIADVGNRGQSTGPHLHFEVHSGGLYANRSNPTPWLTARGISIGGC